MSMPVAFQSLHTKKKKEKKKEARGSVYGLLYTVKVVIFVHVIFRTSAIFDIFVCF